MTYRYDNEIEKQIIKSTSLLELANGMRSTTRIDENGSNNSTIFETPVSTRILKTFERLTKGLNYDFACDVFVNNFNDDERPAVRMLLEGNEYGIKSDLGIETN